VHFECRLHQIVRLPGRTPSANHDLVIGRVVAVHIDEGVMTEGRVDVVKMKPIARLGYKDYAAVEAIFQMEKTTPEDCVSRP
jgi:flavin reductase (DIM6/NTAB) family NADH-FMN oxidoreductase RutF